MIYSGLITVCCMARMNYYVTMLQEVKQLSQ